MAHPNKYSTCRNPRWCLRGAIAVCDDKLCPFNHHTTIEAYDAFYKKGHTPIRVETIVAETAAHTRTRELPLNVDAPAFTPSPSKKPASEKKVIKRAKKQNVAGCSGGSGGSVSHKVKNGTVYYAPHPHNVTIADYVYYAIKEKK